MEEVLFEQIRNQIANGVGLLVREQDESMLRKVVAERMRMLKLTGLEQYCQFLATDAGILHEREEITALLTTGETYFFRDSGQHALLQNIILPELIKRHMEKRVLRIWCAACSSGEEAYSLAILLDELMPDQSQWNILILGTDINRHVIEKARNGIYTEWSFRGMSSERRQRYFQHHKGAWVLDESIRRRVTFQMADLVADKFPDYAAKLYDMDLILCRNTFIYMTPHVVFRIVDKFAETLVEGGFLITGHAELYAHHLGKLRARVFPESIVYQRVSAPFFSQSIEPPVEVQKPKPAPEQFTTVFPVEGKAKVAAHVTMPPTAAKQPVKEQATSEILRAWTRANQGQREMAAKSCSEMIAKNPLDAEPHYLMALLAQESGDSAGTMALLKKVIYLDPSFIAAYLDLGDIYARQGESARAVKMRSTARDFLKKLPGDGQVKLYGASTAKEVLHYVEHLLNTNSQ